MVIPNTFNNHTFVDNHQNTANSARTEYTFLHQLNSTSETTGKINALKVLRNTPKKFISFSQKKHYFSRAKTGLQKISKSLTNKLISHRATSSPRPFSSVFGSSSTITKYSQASEANLQVRSSRLHNFHQDTPARNLSVRKIESYVMVCNTPAKKYIKIKINSRGEVLLSRIGSLFQDKNALFQQLPNLGPGQEWSLNTGNFLLKQKWEHEKLSVNGQIKYIFDKSLEAAGHKPKVHSYWIAINKLLQNWSSYRSEYFCISYEFIAFLCQLTQSAIMEKPGLFGNDFATDSITSLCEQMAFMPHSQEGCTVNFNDGPLTRSNTELFIKVASLVYLTQTDLPFIFHITYDNIYGPVVSIFSMSEHKSHMYELETRRSSDEISIQHTEDMHSICTDISTENNESDSFVNEEQRSQVIRSSMSSLPTCNSVNSEMKSDRDSIIENSSDTIYSRMTESLRHYCDIHPKSLKKVYGNTNSESCWEIFLNVAWDNILGRRCDHLLCLLEPLRGYAGTPKEFQKLIFLLDDMKSSGNSNKNHVAMMQLIWDFMIKYPRSYTDEDAVPEDVKAKVFEIKKQESSRDYTKQTFSKDIDKFLFYTPFLSNVDNNPSSLEQFIQEERQEFAKCYQTLFQDGSLISNSENGVEQYKATENVLFHYFVVSPILRVAAPEIYDKFSNQQWKKEIETMGLEAEKLSSHTKQIKKAEKMAEDEYNMIIGKIKALYENETIDCDLDSDCDELDSDQVSEDFVDCQSQQIEKDVDPCQPTVNGFSRLLDRPDIYKFSEIGQRGTTDDYNSDTEDTQKSDQHNLSNMSSCQEFGVYMSCEYLDQQSNFEPRLVKEWINSRLDVSLETELTDLDDFQDFEEYVFNDFQSKGLDTLSPLNRSTISLVSDVSQDSFYTALME